MLNNPLYKNYASQIAKLFCTAANNKTICEASIKQRILANFNDVTFEHFLQNINYGRYYILNYSNWHADDNNCRSMKIDVKLTDAITGEIKTGYWFYIAADCGNKQYYYPDLNNLIGKNGYTLLDEGIKSKTNEDIKKSRLVYNPKALTYGIDFIPSVPGGGGGGGKIIVNQPPESLPENLPAVPQQNLNIAGFNFDTKTIMIIAGVGLAAWFLLKK